MEEEHDRVLRRIAQEKMNQRIPKFKANSDNPDYEICAVITHITTESSLNHFVLHVRIPGVDPDSESPKWILCDGTTFALANNAPMDTACFYLYRQKSK